MKAMDHVEIICIKQHHVNNVEDDDVEILAVEMLYISNVMCVCAPTSVLKDTLSRGPSEVHHHWLCSRAQYN